MLNVEEELVLLFDEKVSNHSKKFFKAFKGGYGEGDEFLGIRVPIIRKFVKKYKHIDLDTLNILVKSKYHEVRLFSLLALVNQYEKANLTTKHDIFNLYIDNLKYVNNWDLIDTTTPHIVGRYMFETKNNSLLFQLVKSNNLWSRRVAMLSLFYYIKQNDFSDAIKMAKILLHDKHDLMHKAVGWMLREIGKRDLYTLEDFLKTHYKNMPRTMLRYAIEKFEEPKRLAYLHNLV